MKPDLSKVSPEFHDPHNLWYKISSCVLFKGLMNLGDHGYGLAFGEPGSDRFQALVVFIASLQSVGNPKSRVILLAEYLNKNIELTKWPIESPWNHTVLTKYPPFFSKSK